MTKSNTVIPVGFKITKCPPANCSGGDTNSITRRELAKERREYREAQKAEATGIYPVGLGR